MIKHQVARTPYGARAPSEPDVHVSAHPAQASVILNRKESVSQLGHAFACLRGAGRSRRETGSTLTGRPIGSLGGIVWASPSSYQNVTVDGSPRMFDHKTARGGVAEHPVIAAVRVEGAKIARNNPPLRLMRVRIVGPFIQQLPEVAVERRKGGAGDHRLIVAGPSAKGAAYLCEYITSIIGSTWRITEIACRTL